MQKKHWLIVMLIVLMGMGFAQAESFDCSDDRMAYAGMVAALGKADGELVSRSDQAVEGKYVLVLFRLSGGEVDFGNHEPAVLVEGPHGCCTAAYTSVQHAQQAVDYLKTLPNVRYAELDGEVEACETEYSFHSDGASEMGFSSAAQWCGKAGEGSVSVAVVDSGVYRHPLLSARMLASGYDYVDADADATSDTFGHGTHVAGIVVDCTPSLPVYVKPIRVLNASGKGTLANTTSAVFEAAESGCDIINLSLVSSTHSDALEDAIRFATECGSAVVISAGNHGDNTSRYCPVHMEDAGVIVVGACSGDMDSPVQADYSNFGPSIDVYAFGTAISSCSLSGGYTTKTGTSQAAPHVSALGSVLKLLFPSLGSSEIENRIRRLSGDGETNVPDAALLKPRTLGASADEVYLPVNTEIGLMTKAEPALSFLTLEWSCADPSIAEVDSGGILRCKTPGTTVLHGEGPAKADVQITLHVTEDNGSLHLPEKTTRIGEEAFVGIAVKSVFLPNLIEVVSPDVFGPLDTVFYYGSSIDVFENMSQCGACFVVGTDPEILSFLNSEGIPYVVNLLENQE